MVEFMYDDKLMGQNSGISLVKSKNNSISTFSVLIFNYPKAGNQYTST